MTSGTRAGPDAVVIGRDDLYPALGDPALESMNFLNEVANRFPDAVSFAAGRPFEEFFDVEDVHRYLRTYCRYLCTERGYDDRQVNRLLLQYGRTKGIIHKLVARNLAVDEGIEVDPESVVVTAGCQEAMYLALRVLRSGPRDALLAVVPNYVGITGAARLVDMPVVPVRGGDAGIDLADLVDAVGRARAAGRCPRACYVVPDFANPSGVSMSLETRQALLDAAQAQRLLLLEDNPYGIFHGDREHLPTLKALDRFGQVVYLGSFAKTGMPGARVGYAVADQRVADGRGATVPLADELAKVKSMLTINTSPLAQAVIGGKLLEHGCSMIRANQREARVYRDNLRQVLDGLAKRFPRHHAVGSRIAWNTPTGGFFVVLTLPFRVDDELLEHSARRHGVLWTPMHHFYSGKGGFNQLRLSVSLLTPQLIEKGLDGLAALVTEGCG